MAAADWLSPGAAILLVLAALSLWSIALIALKAMDLHGTLAGQSAREDLLARFDAAVERPPTHGGTAPADRVLAAGLAALGRGLPRTALAQELERRGNAELAQLSRHVRTLDLIAVVAPLLGLLGTVLGMIVSFRSLELAGGAANASVLAGGIWQALLTTAAGLVVAIPAALAAGLCSARVERVAGQIEDAATRLLVVLDARAPVA